jgi:hypothetical protein
MSVTDTLLSSMPDQIESPPSLLTDSISLHIVFQLSARPTSICHARTDSPAHGSLGAHSPRVTKAGIPSTHASLDLYRLYVNSGFSLSVKSSHLSPAQTMVSQTQTHKFHLLHAVEPKEKRACRDRLKETELGHKSGQGRFQRGNSLLVLQLDVSRLCSLGSLELVLPSAIPPDESQVDQTGAPAHDDGDFRGAVSRRIFWAERLRSDDVACK